MKLILLALLSNPLFADVHLENLAKTCPKGSKLVRDEDSRQPSKQQSFWRCYNKKTGLTDDGYFFGVAHWKSGDYLIRSITPQDGLLEFKYNANKALERVIKKEEGKTIADCTINYTDNGFAIPTNNSICDAAINKINTSINIPYQSPEQKSAKFVGECKLEDDGKFCKTIDGKIYIESHQVDLSDRVMHKLTYDAFGSLIETESSESNDTPK